LAYIFTYRDFTQGTLGLAWVGSSGRKFYYIYIVFMYASNFDSLTKSKDSEHDSIHVLFEIEEITDINTVATEFTGF
jgi:hypothetical protein